MLRVLLATLALCSSPGLAQRILVLPVGGDIDASTSATLGRAVETAVRDAVPDAEVMTTASLETSIEVSRLQDCALDEAVGACISEIADAANADVVLRPHLGRLGDEFLLTITLTGGTSARLLGQGQRRVPASRPTALLDVIPELVRLTAVDAGLVRASREVDGGAIAAAVGGAVGAGVGVTVLVVRSLVGAQYDDGNLNRADASTWETMQQPALYIGAGVVIVGGIVALAGTGAALWPIITE